MIKWLQPTLGREPKRSRLWPSKHHWWRWLWHRFWIIICIDLINIYFQLFFDLSFEWFNINLIKIYTFPITLIMLYIYTQYILQSNHSPLNDSNRLDQDLISDKSDQGWINLKLSDIVHVQGCLQSVTRAQSSIFPLIPHLLLRTLFKIRLFCFIFSFLGGEFVEFSLGVCSACVSEALQLGCYLKH